MICFVAPLPAGARTLLVVGDSLSAAFGMNVREGWVALLAERLRAERPDYTVVNASISGDTTANGLARLPRLLQLHKPAVVVIELGGNDGLRGLSLDEMKNNLTALVSSAKQRNARVLLVGVDIPPNYGRRYTEKFRAVYREVSKRTGVALVPSILDGIGTEAALMQADRLHPGASAQARMLENVWVRLRSLL